MKKGSILISVLLAYSQMIVAQPDRLNTVIPPSPEAAAITKYGLYPVSMFTGIPGISLPIYTIKAGNVTVPISLDYHASGIKVDDYPGSVGLGWILNAGGVITRSVIGIPDDYAPEGSFYNTPMREEDFATTDGDDDYRYCEDVIAYNIDSEPDLFAFNFCGKTGKFVFKPNSNKKVLTIEYNNLQIELQQNGNFKVVDAEGNTYLFEDKITSQAYTDALSAKYYPVTSWYLTKIIPLNSTDTIAFSYDKVGSGILRSYSQSYVLGKEVDNAPLPGDCGSVYYQILAETRTTINYLFTSFFNVKQINFPNGQINFNYDYTAIDYGNKVLNNIEVQSSGTLVKKFSLSHDYFFSTAGSNPYAYVNDEYRLKLTALTENEVANGNRALTHQFVYEDQKQLPPRKNYGLDKWGYYNGHPENTTLITLNASGNQYTVTGPGGAGTTTSSIVPGNRSVDSASMQAGMLKKIIYPTGGYTEFAFEPNVYMGTSVPEYGGGLRVKTISSYTADGALAKKETYKYGENESGTGKLSFFPYLFSTNSYTLKYTYSFNPCAGTFPAVLLTALDYPLYHASDFGGSKVGYTTVTKYEAGSGLTNGKTVYTYDYELDNRIDTHAPTAQSLIDLSWKSGHLITEKSYKSTGTDTYQLVKEDSSVYTTFNVDTAYGLGVSPKNIYIGTVQNTHGYIPCCQGYEDDFYVFEYPVISAAKKKTKAIETVYSDDPDGPTMVTETDFSYDRPETLLQTKMETTNSKGETLATFYKYPHDFSSQSPYTEMVNTRHIWSPVIEKSVYKNGTSFLQSAKTNYNFWNNGWGINNSSSLVVPQSVDLKVLDNPSETRIHFNGYDANGNLLEQQKTDDAKKSYVWGYDHSYPIAEATNAAQADIAYTSFEDGDMGNWNISSADRDTLYFLTGRKSYDLSKGNITKWNLTSGNVYIVSYWSRNGSYSINGGSVSTKTGRSVTGWTYYEQTVVTSSISITISGSGDVDELRLYPKGAQMTSYTYSPLVGMTSADDPNGEITYYEYDGFQRLKNIRDYQSNIAKNYQYNYSNSCGPNCYVLPMQTFIGTNTLGYPVGVFNVKGKLLGNAASQTTYISTWMSDTADSHTGTIEAGDDALHFKFTVNTGRTVPTSLTGCRYYQYDVAYTQLDAVRSTNGFYVDFGDGTGMRLGTTSLDSNVVRAPNTSLVLLGPNIYWVHDYPDTSLKTITIYHNDRNGTSSLDNAHNPASSLMLVKNLRGNIPQHMDILQESCYQQETASTVAAITNWNSISSIINWGTNLGDGMNPCRNLRFAQDFMANNRDLQEINTTYYGMYNASYRDTTFKISRLKSDWNHYFTKLNILNISDEHWNREDLSDLINLKYVRIYATNQNHSNNPTNNPVIPIPASAIDNIINQIAAGAGQTLTGGDISILSGGTTRTAASDSSVTFLKSKGWTIHINEVYQ